MTRMNTACLILSFFVLSWPVWSDSEPHGAHDHTLELGCSLSAVKLSHESQWLGGVHLHLSHRLARKGLGAKMALGLSLETLFGGDPHTGVMAGLSFNPWKGLVLSCAPGILWANEGGERETRFLLHFELGYGFELWDLEVGPLIGIAFSGEDQHFALGVHLGKGF